MTAGMMMLYGGIAMAGTGLLLLLVQLTLMRRRKRKMRDARSVGDTAAIPVAVAAGAKGNGVAQSNARSHIPDEWESTEKLGAPMNGSDTDKTVKLVYEDSPASGTDQTEKLF